jgi:hypothetical protein
MPETQPGGGRSPDARGRGASREPVRRPRPQPSELNDTAELSASDPTSLRSKGCVYSTRRSVGRTRPLAVNRFGGNSRRGRSKSCRPGKRTSIAVRPRPASRRRRPKPRRRAESCSPAYPNYTPETPGSQSQPPGRTGPARMGTGNQRIIRPTRACSPRYKDVQYRRFSGSFASTGVQGRAPGRRQFGRRCGR